MQHLSSWFVGICTKFYLKEKNKTGIRGCTLDVINTTYLSPKTNFNKQDNREVFEMVLTSASEACVSPKIWHALVTLGYTVAHRTLAKFSLQPSLEATVGFCEVALASVDHLQRIFWHFKWVRETVEPAFVKVLKNRKWHWTLEGNELASFYPSARRNVHLTTTSSLCSLNCWL